MPRDLFLRACAGDTVPRPPAWIMRQAGRYLPEYREVRSRVDFLTLCRTPELAAEVTLQPIRRFNLDAAIVFSDIMMPLESMGVRMTFAPGPHIETPVRDAAAVDRLQVPAAADIAPYVYATLKLLRQALPVPVIGFAGAPWTLAAYLVQGRGEKDFPQLRAMLAADPDASGRLLTALAEMTARYLVAQVEAGAQAVQLFDTWAGLLSAADYRRWVLPGVQHIMDTLRPMGVPRIYFAQNAGALLPVLREIDCEVMGVDWRLDLDEARRGLRPGVVLQGNLDPAILFAAPDQVRAATARVLAAGGNQRHIFNLGHGILPETPIASVEAVLETVGGVAAVDGRA